MPRLAFQQAEVELAEFFVQMRHQGFETLATAGFDKGADHQGIHQLDRFVAAHHLAQTGGIAPGVQLAQFHLALLDQAHDLLMVHQLFPGQPRHHIDQVNVGVVLGDQAQGGAGRFEFANICITATNLCMPPDTKAAPYIFSQCLSCDIRML
ncbi:hypothetical protein EMIT0357P_20205 [Pseudomonas marginalis]